MRSMKLVIAIALATPFVAGCEGPMLIDLPDAGPATTDAGALDSGTDAGVTIEPAGGSECDQQDHCAACIECSQAPHQLCVGLAVQCSDDPECVALARCVAACGDSDCARTCATAHSSATSLLLSLYRCAYCDACPADCRADYASWCVAPPF